MAHLYGHLVKDGKTGDFHPLECTENPDGTFTLKVDTELSLDGADVNLKVGSTDGTAANSTYLKTEADGTTIIKEYLGVPQHYNGNADTVGTGITTVAFANPTRSLTIENLSANDLFVSFDGDANTFKIITNDKLVLNTAISSLRISASVDASPYQILTTE